MYIERGDGICFIYSYEDIGVSVLPPDLSDESTIRLPYPNISHGVWQKTSIQMPPENSYAGSSDSSAGSRLFEQ